MFSGNERISAGQLLRLIVLVLFVKGALLLPVFANGISGLLFVFLLLLLFCLLINVLAKNVKDSLFSYVEERLGKWNAILLGIWSLGFLLVNAAYFFRTFGILAQRYILPEQPEAVLMALALCGAVYLATGGIEVQGRNAGIWYPVLLIPMLLLLFFAGLPVKTEPQDIAEMFSVRLGAGDLLLQLGVFGELPLFLLLLTRSGRRAKSRKAFFRGTFKAFLLLFLLFLILTGTFGQNGIDSLEFPVVSLMSAARIPGGFLERWDVIFTGLLLMGLLIGAQYSLYIGGVIGEKLFPKGSHRVVVPVLAVVAYLVAMIPENYEKGVEVYGMISGYFFMPGILAVLLLLLWIEKIKKKKLLLLLGSVLLLGGCAGRELEDRSFPSVLVVEWDDRDDFLEKEDRIRDMDYSHVKAVLFEMKFAKETEELEKVVKKLQDNPEFAGNTLLFLGDEEALDLADDEEAGYGKELKDYYKNHDREDESVTLTDLLYFFQNGEEMLAVPLLKVERDSLIPYSYVNIQP